MNRPNAYLVMDGAWGSCGKGLLAGKLALDRNPDLIVCNFGPNAGHTFIKDGKSIMTQQVPTGAVNRSAALLLGPGSIIDPKILENELQMLSDLNVRNRLYIHPRASVVQPIDKEREGALVSIGSTRKGTAFVGTLSPGSGASPAMTGREDGRTLSGAAAEAFAATAALRLR